MMIKDNVSPLGSIEDISNARKELMKFNICLLYTSDAADD